MNFHPASPISVAAFLLIVAVVIAALLVAVRHAYGDDPARTRTITFRTTAVVAAWLGVLAALIASGKMSALPLSGLPFFFGSVLVVNLVAGLSHFGGRLAAGVPTKFLVLFLSFRLPLELVLHSWSQQGTIPTNMTWTGQNWDIVSGIIGLIAFPLAGRHRGIAWAANLVGFALLLNVIRVAVLSSPLPFGWPVNPPLLLALHLPYALIGPVCVGGALLGHLVLTRALLAGTRAR